MACNAEQAILNEMRALRRDLRPPTPSPPMYWLLTVAPIWACVALAPDERTFAHSRAYAVMATLADEHTWSYGSGAVFVAAALCGAMRAPGFREAGVALLGVWHAAVAFCVFAAAPFSIGAAPFLVLAALCGLLFWRAR